MEKTNIDMENEKHKTFLLDEKCGKSFAVIVALIRNGKVHALKEFDERDDYFNAMVNLFKKRGYAVEVFEIEDKRTKQTSKPAYIRNGHPANKIVCIESGEVFMSVGAASSILRISKDSIYKSLKLGATAGKLHFRYWTQDE